MSFSASHVSLVRHHKDNKPLYFIAQIEDINDLKQKRAGKPKVDGAYYTGKRRAVSGKTAAHHA